MTSTPIRSAGPAATAPLEEVDWHALGPRAVAELMGVDPSRGLSDEDAAGTLALALGHPTDASVILVIVTANALLGVFHERRAERAMAALRRLAASEAHVVRGRRKLVVRARNLVPGDVLVLAAGDAVGADARLLETASLEVAAAALTGESLAAAHGGG